MYMTDNENMKRTEICGFQKFNCTSTMKKLNELKYNDVLELNDEKFKVSSYGSNQLIESLKKIGIEKEILIEGFYLSLTEEKNGETKYYELIYIENEVEYSLIEVLDGPALLNPDPNIAFFQKGNKTYKYKITRTRKDEIVLKEKLKENE